MLHSICNVTFILKLLEVYHAFKRKSARLPGGDHSTTDRQQMEAAHFMKFTCKTLAIQ